MKWLMHLYVAMGTGLLAAGLNWLAMIRWRRTVSAHWTVRARVLFPARKGAQLLTALLPLGVAAWCSSFTDLAASDIAVRAAVAMLGAVLGSYPMSRELMPELTFRVWLPQALLTWAIALGTIAVFLLSMALVPEEPHWTTPLFALPAILLVTLFAYGLTLRLGRAIRSIVPANERLTALVTRVAQDAGIPLPRIWISRGPLATAYAFIPTRELLFSEGLLRALTDAEVTGICAHEIQHLRESKGAVAKRIAGSCILVPLIFIRPLAHALGVGGILIPCLAIFVIARLAARFARKMEVAADRAGLATQEADGVYARALEKLYEINAMPAVMRGKNLAHPHLYDRLLAAGITPTYPRPAPPGEVGLQPILLIVLFVIVMTVTFILREIVFAT